MGSQLFIPTDTPLCSLILDYSTYLFDAANDATATATAAKCVISVPYLKQRIINFDDCMKRREFNYINMSGR